MLRENDNSWKQIVGDCGRLHFALWISEEVTKMEEKKESTLPFVVMLITLATGVIVLVSFLLSE